MDLLIRQHREVEQLFGRIKSANGGEKTRLLGQVTEALTMHAALEERFLYPMLKNHGMADVVERSTREHAQVRQMISELLDMKRKDPRLDQLVEQLESSVKTHVAEEENEVFPRAKEKIDSAVLADTERQMTEAQKGLENKELIAAADEGQVPAP